MLVTKETATISGDLTFEKKVEMGFDPAARNMQVRNAIRMYANPRLAALREYTSNARDAHQAAGYTGPVEVTLPSALHPYLTIVDKGVGLDATELEGFGQFGHTTKDGSNDYIGGFGLGSKSGLAVADQFTVISVKGGKKNVVVVGWDESGAPSLGFLAEQDTKEPNGTTIQIPSATGHNDWAGIIEGKTFIGWKPGSIVINDKAPAKSVHNPAQFRKIDGGWLTVEERESGRHYWPDTIHALVHGVYYALPYHKFGADGRTLARILDGSVLEIENGSVDILPSRDDLEWTDRTEREVRRVAALLKGSIVREYETQIKSAKTFLDAKRIADAMEEIGLPTDNLSHKGVMLDWTKEGDSMITVANVKDSSTSSNGYQNNRAAGSTRSTNDAHKVHSILIHGGGGETKSGYYRKDQAFITESRDTVPFILSEVEAGRADTARKVRLYFTNQAPADLPKGFVLAMKRVISAADFTEQASEQRKVWMKEAAASRKAGAAPKSVDRQLRVVSGYNNWNYSFALGERSEQAIIADGGPVVVLHSGDELAARVLTTHTGGGYSSAMNPIMRFIATHRAATTFVVLAKNHKAENLSIKGWTTLTDWLTAALKATPTFTPLQVNVRNYLSSRPHYRYISQIDAAYVDNIKNKTMREWMKEYITPTTLPKSDELLIEVASVLPQYAPTQPEPSDFIPWERYPLLPFVGVGGDEGHLLVDYINLVDSTRKD